MLGSCTMLLKIGSFLKKTRDNVLLRAQPHLVRMQIVKSQIWKDDRNFLVLTSVFNFTNDGISLLLLSLEFFLAWLLSTCFTKYISYTWVSKSVSSHESSRMNIHELCVLFLDFLSVSLLNLLHCTRFCTQLYSSTVTCSNGQSDYSSGQPSCRHFQWQVHT